MWCTCEILNHCRRDRVGWGSGSVDLSVECAIKSVQYVLGARHDGGVVRKNPED